MDVDGWVLGMPDTTVEAWCNRWFHTGDGSTRDQAGDFHFPDRKKDTIRRSGDNISAMEVEIEIIAHPTLLESGVIAVPSEWGEDEVVAVVNPVAGRHLDSADLIRFLTHGVAGFMVPRYVELVDELPKTPTEKIRNAALRELGVRATTWDRDGEARSTRP